VMQAASKFAARLLAESNADDQRLSRMYVIAFGREPTAEERQADQAFLAEIVRSQAAELEAAQRHQQAWTALCHVVLAANEFLYVK